MAKSQIIYNNIKKRKETGFDMHGIAASHQNPDVCHSKRFVARVDLGTVHLPEYEVKTLPPPHTKTNRKIKT